MLLQAVLAAVSAAVYVVGAIRILPSWDLGRLTAAVCRGNWAVVAFVVSLLSTSWHLTTLIGLPLRRSRATPGAGRRGCGSRVFAPLCVLASCLATTWPALLNVYVRTSPSVAPGVVRMRPYLPAVGAGMQIVVLPKMLRKIASTAKVPVHELQILQGASSWALSLVVVAVLSPDCRGAWWLAVEACQEVETWLCKQSRRHGALKVTNCWRNRVLDVRAAGSDYDYFNMTHCMIGSLVTAEDICGERWPQKGTRCTSNIVDIVGLFVFQKMLVACCFPVVVCILGSFGRRTLPWWTPLGVLRGEENDRVPFGVVLQIPSLSIDWKIMDISQAFSPTNGAQRLAVWSDLHLSWGLLYPPIAAAGLAHFLIERFCHSICGNFGLRPSPSGEVARIPRHNMIIWFMAANVLSAIHTASVVDDEPSAWHVVASFLALLASWIIGFGRGFWLLKAAANRTTTAGEIEIQTISDS
eukprot:TRINITY_DN38430_c0_g2_i1.p1 TRINITY_DN38430_c0_g2~~TRINITY_DN38430_c0_g2_i1.p1  ORF type:complete len:469 (-),score=20.10 TRINITY_DN38430_c0_g2_i1:115-1521(-)